MYPDCKTTHNGTALLYNINDHLLTKPQHAQNAVARILTKTRKYGHITPVLREMHWLSVGWRIIFKLLLLTWKCLHENDHQIQWRSHWGQGGGVAPLTAKNLSKIVKKGENQEKLRKEGKIEKRGKIGKVLSLCPSWQIGLATLLIIFARTHCSPFSCSSTTFFKQISSYCPTNNFILQRSRFRSMCPETMELSPYKHSWDYFTWTIQKKKKNAKN